MNKNSKIAQYMLKDGYNWIKSFVVIELII